MATRPPTTASSTYMAANAKKFQWKTIYPIYLNSKKSISEGRRMSKAYCVENPTLQGLFEGLKTFGLPCEVELNKTHPKDFGVPGRIKVRIFNDDHKPLNPEIRSKDELLKKLGKAIPASAQGKGGEDPGKKGKKGKKP